MNNPWINVEERLPEVLVRVLVFCPGDGIATATFLDNEWYVNLPGDRPNDPTHWKPLPEEPEFEMMCLCGKRNKENSACFCEMSFSTAMKLLQSAMYKLNYLGYINLKQYEVQEEEEK